ncbi:MAG: glycosyl transferase group 1, partial [Kosmotogaceae bacterium]|nr:glycosyl transferase group 1 [Kosmotogaceae bacterium]
EAYGIADIVTYPTVFEGWGNQLLEALVYKKPLALFRYSVFKSDIQNSGISFVDLGDRYIYTDGLAEIPEQAIRSAVKEIAELLFDEKKYEEAAEKNFQIGREKFSLETLGDIVNRLIADMF